MSNSMGKKLERRDGAKGRGEGAYHPLGQGEAPFQFLGHVVQQRHRRGLRRPEARRLLVGGGGWRADTMIVSVDTQ